MCLLPDLCFQFASKVFFPTPADLVKRSQRFGVPTYVAPEPKGDKGVNSSTVFDDNEENTDAVRKSPIKKQVTR